LNASFSLFLRLQFFTEFPPSPTLLLSALAKKHEKFLNAARTGNLNLLKSKFIFLYVHLFVSGCVLIVYFGLDFIGIELAGQLDEGKGLAITVAGIKNVKDRGALHFAAMEGKTKVLKYLLEELKLDVDTKDDDGMRLISSIVSIYYFLIFLHALFYIVLIDSIRLEIKGYPFDILSGKMII
jgi:membrane-anchored glycerophosphoryl diester phosphodiesterase (GDPDase)